MESPGNTQINGDLMHARRKLRNDGPAPPPAKTFAPAARSRDPRDESSCVIEEVFDDEEEDARGQAGAKALPGYTRVQIEEDSDSEDEVEVSKVGFHKVQIQEASDDSEEEGEPEREPAAAPGNARAEASAAPGVSTGFHKVQIVDESDSDEEDCMPKVSATVQSTASAPQVCTAAEETNFGDMD